VPDCTNLFRATSDDAIYIGMDNSEQTIIADGINKIISGALINKTISGIGYYPANLQLTGTITLSGNNSEFNEKAFIVGDSSTNTIITLTNSLSLPKTDITVEKNGTLVLTGNENYILSNNISVKSGAHFKISSYLIISHNAMLEFQS
jgi:hypothetical protein